jgi:hypothetical protein
MNHSRYLHTASVLTHGKVLVTSGENRFGSLNSAESYDPSTGVWTPTGNLSIARYDHTASFKIDLLFVKICHSITFF